MSWNKNTVNHSEVDAVIRVLADLKTNYRLAVLGSVKGMGLNDTILDREGFEATRTYELRRLEYNDVVVLEKMVRTADCDADDTILSFRFFLKDEPKSWEIEEVVDYEEIY